MKLQKRLSRKIGNIEYAKWIVTIPPKLIKAVGWRAGQSLTAEKEADGIKIRAGKKDK